MEDPSENKDLTTDTGVGLFVGRHLRGLCLDCGITCFAFGDVALIYMTGSSNPTVVLVNFSSMASFVVQLLFDLVLTEPFLR